MSTGSVRIADVARVAGVSRQTVSNVLNAPQWVRADTRARVENAITSLGYAPNRVAQALRAQLDAQPRSIALKRRLL
jgi:DNA-binding LacI/PurR family transcriptional regulator